MKQLYGYNILKIDDKASFLTHIRRLRPPALLFYASELDFARQVKSEFPDMIVILRSWPDDNLYTKLSPKAWLDQHESQAAGGLYLYTCNESGLTADNIQWHMQLMDLAIARSVHLVMLNPATGTWDTPELERLKPLLIKASQHRDLFIIGLHSYAGGVITSGIAGGIPTHAGVDPNGADRDKGRNLIPVENWPSPVLDTTFHLGRHNWIVNYCASIGLIGDKAPRFGLTETGFDYLGDIGQWLNSLNHDGFTSVNGWKTLQSQWVKWWGKQGADSWYVTQLEYAAKNLLNGLEFALIFAYGDDGNWGNYDVFRSDIPMLLEGLSNPAPTPPVITPPFDYGDLELSLLEITRPNLTMINLRAMPSIDSAILLQVPDGSQVNYSQNAHNSGDFNWHKVVYKGVTGFMAETANYQVTKIFTPPPAEDKLHTVIIRIPGLSLKEAQELINNVIVSIEGE